MTRLDTFQLRRAIPTEEFDYNLLCHALAQYSGVRQKIHNLIKAGVITRVKKGLYVFGAAYNQGPVCKEVLANLIYGPSCISLEYALGYHGVIPERVETVTSITSKKDKKFNTPIGHFTYRYLALEKYSLGIEQVYLDPHHPVLMATPEKALCDYVILNKVLLKESQDVRNFLNHDLRIAEEYWIRFDLNHLLELKTAYRNNSIQLVINEILAKRS